MSHSILNVVRHQGGSFRLGIICREFQRLPQPNQIIVRGINENPIVFHVDNYYTIHGSIVHPEIRTWLEEHFPREAQEPLWLIKFEFEATDDSHVYTYVGASDFRKNPHRRELIDTNGNVIQYQTIDELIQIAWND